MALGRPIITDEFLRFIDLAQPLVEQTPPPSLPPIAAFREFILAVRPFIIHPLRESIARLAPRLALIRRWLVGHDLLFVAGFTYNEDPYTKLIAWALEPATHPESALERQRAWLHGAWFAERLEDLTRPAQPRAHYYTGAGIPDMVFQYDTFAIVLEAKTGTEEHPTPLGTLQTVAYPDAVKKAMCLGESSPVYVVFLTPNRRRAAHPTAFNTTFAEFSLRLASVLERFALPEDLRSAFAMLFTHFLTRAAPPGIDIRSAIRSFGEWESHLDDDDYLMRKADEIFDVIDGLAPEVRTWPIS